MISTIVRLQERKETTMTNTTANENFAISIVDRIWTQNDMILGSCHDDIWHVASGLYFHDDRSRYHDAAWDLVMATFGLTSDETDDVMALALDRALAEMEASED
jgi:hypothetical protein